MRWRRVGRGSGGARRQGFGDAAARFFPLQVSPKDVNLASSDSISRNFAFETPMQEPPAPSEKRQGPDRRRRPTSPWSRRSLFGGRRRSVRRAEDRDAHVYVDRYGPEFGLLLLTTLALCLADAFLTLELIGLGAEELNPVMDYFLRKGPVPFLTAKYVLTASGLVFLLIHKEYPLFSGRLRGKTLLFCLPALYALLIAYEVALILG